MSELKVVIDRQKCTAIFSGRGTFESKEEIKRLGPAKWLAAQKSWEVSNFSLTAEELSIQFPLIFIEEATIKEANGGALSKHASAEAAPVMGRAQNSDVALAENPVTLPAQSEIGAIPESVSVSELIRQVSFRISQAFPGVVYLRGILNSVNFGKGRVFLQLRDADQKEHCIDAVIWGNAEQVCANLYQAGFQLEADLDVMFQGKVQVWNKGVRVALQITGVVAEYTISKVAAQREVTNERLRKEGLFALNKEKKLPFLPTRLGILTSAGGTVINDFRASLDEASFRFELFWLHVAVQGREAKEQIIRGFERLAQLENLDAIVLIRGGGGVGDLAVFNEYDVAKAICMSPVPVVSAIGHQTDQSSAQDVSCLSLGVPKDVGRVFADIVKDLRRRFVEAAQAMKQSVTPLLENRMSLLQKVRESIHFAGMTQLSQARQQLIERGNVLQILSFGVIESRIQTVLSSLREIAQLAQFVGERKRQEMVLIGQRLKNGLDRQIQQAGQKLTLFLDLVRLGSRFVDEQGKALVAYSRMFEEVDPVRQLQRGFSLIRDGRGKIITRGSQLSPNEAIEIEFHDIKRAAIVKDGGTSDDPESRKKL